MKKKTPGRCDSNEIGDCVGDICDVIQDGVQLGLDLLDCLCTLKAPLICAPFQLPKLFALCPLPLPFPGLSTCLTKESRCGCDIPPPCWAPKELCAVHSAVRPGETASVDIRVTNCGAETRTFTFEAVGAGATLSPASMSLGPMQRGHSVASVTTAASAQIGSEREFLIWVRGCYDHFFRWTVTVSEHAHSSADKVHVEDGPDYVHHWYDHFYCERPCAHKG